MLDNLLQGLKGQVGDLFQNNGVDAGKADDVVPISGESVKDSLMSEVLSGNLDGLQNIFKGGIDLNNPIVGNIVSQLTGKLSSGLDINSDASSGIASKIVPMIMDVINGKLGGKFDVESLSSLIGGDAGGLLDKAKDLLGGFFK